ncbi:GerMN domain-containing protein [Citricoccus sp. NR2]|uniref:GerMN domain-containing protein n=1 Tax=Citricoccus sp. NR2 TaxID=3004095 RepID=UPI0022DD0D92|nr:GerMN domain-containing protein [Citricoccus sp. NR2]WBL20193.1 GerMN domain-containing protein [Citricoccus sp. NR2]
MNPAAPRPRRRAERRVSAVAAGCALLLTLAGCAEESSSPGDADPTSAADELDLAPDDDGFAPLPLYFVALSGQYPSGVTGAQIGCEDLLLQVNTVPMKTEDPVEDALNFLLQDQQYRHGDPALTNSVLLSSESLTLQDYEIQGDTVEVNLSGSVVTRSECESYRIRAQLEATAAAAAGVEDARILVDGEDLDTLLGLDPFERGEQITTD